MNLLEFPLLTDENVNSHVVEWLRRVGGDVATVADAGLQGATDRDLLEFALREGRVVVTHDRDFGKLAVAERVPIVGIVYVRPGHIEPEFTIGSLKSLIGHRLNLQPPFVVVVQRSGNEVVVRLRELRS